MLWRVTDICQGTAQQRRSSTVPNTTRACHLQWHTDPELSRQSCCWGGGCCHGKLTSSSSSARAVRRRTFMQGSVPDPCRAFGWWCASLSQISLLCKKRDERVCFLAAHPASSTAPRKRGWAWVGIGSRVIKSVAITLKPGKTGRVTGDKGQGMVDGHKVVSSTGLQASPYGPGSRGTEDRSLRPLPLPLARWKAPCPPPRQPDLLLTSSSSPCWLQQQRRRSSCSVVMVWASCC